MDILSRETRALLRVPVVRAALDRMMDDPQIEAKTVVLPDGKTIILRRVWW